MLSVLPFFHLMSSCAPWGFDVNETFRLRQQQQQHTNQQLSFSPALSHCFVCDYTTAATSQKKKKKEKRLFFVPHFLSLLMYQCEFSKASAHRPFSKRAKNSKLKEAMTSGRQHRYRYVYLTHISRPRLLSVRVKGIVDSGES